MTLIGSQSRKTEIATNIVIITLRRRAAAVAAAAVAHYNNNKKNNNIFLRSRYCYYFYASLCHCLIG